VAEGATNTQIAERLYLSVNTVRSHLDRIREKTGLRPRVELARLARKDSSAVRLRPSPCGLNGPRDPHLDTDMRPRGPCRHHSEKRMLQSDTSRPSGLRSIKWRCAKCTRKSVG
jgi:hypothetical protein